MLRLPWWALSVVFCLGCGAGGVPLDDRTEGDGVRDQSMGLFVGRTVTDRIDGEVGDNTDWKYVDTVDPGRLRLELSFDNPERLVEGELEFADEFGSRLDRRLISPGQSSYIFAQEVENVPAKFYVKVFVRKGASVYSVGARQSIAATKAPRRESGPPKVVVTTVKVEKKKPKRRSSRKGRKRTRKRTTTTTKKKNVTVEKKKVEVVVTKKTVTVASATPIKGTVIRIIPADDNKSVTLTVRIKVAGQVGKGATGTVYRGGTALGKMRVSSVDGKRLTGILRARAGTVKSPLKVIFPPN